MFNFQKEQVEQNVYPIVFLAEASKLCKIFLEAHFYQVERTINMEIISTLPKGAIQIQVATVLVCFQKNMNQFLRRAITQETA